MLTNRQEKLLQIRDSIETVLNGDIGKNTAGYFLNKAVDGLNELLDEPDTEEVKKDKEAETTIITGVDGKKYVVVDGSLVSVFSDKEGPTTSEEAHEMYHRLQKVKARIEAEEK